MSKNKMKGLFGHLLGSEGKDQNLIHNVMKNEFKDQDEKGRKEVQNFGEEAMYVDHYSGTYYSLITKYK